MNDQLTISREDSDAIFAALRGIERTLKQVKVQERDDQAALYAIWNNVASIHLRLNKSRSETRN
jgi:hypothetical protein